MPRLFQASVSSIIINSKSTFQLSGILLQREAKILAWIKTLAGFWKDKIWLKLEMKNKIN